MKILYFRNEQDFINFAQTGSVVKGGVTYQYNPMQDLYLVPAGESLGALFAKEAEDMQLSESEQHSPIVYHDEGEWHLGFTH